jgi:hypothetical protein
MSTSLRPKVVRYARDVIFQMAEVAVPRDLCRRILKLIDDLSGEGKFIAVDLMG